MYANDVRITEITKGSNRKLSPIIDLSVCLCGLVYRPILDFERQQYLQKQSSYHHFRLLSAILDIIQSGVARCRSTSRTRV